MPTGATHTLGPFTVGHDGRLALRESGTVPAFTFRWRDRLVHASLLACDGQSGRLILQAVLGRVPSSADQAPLRPLSFSMLRGLPAALPESWNLRLLPDHRIRLETEADLARPVTASSLLAEITQFLLTLGPYLDLLDEGGFAPRPPSASDNAGRANICPG